MSKILQKRQGVSSIILLKKDSKKKKRKTKQLKRKTKNKNEFIYLFIYFFIRSRYTRHKCSKFKINFVNK